MKISTHYQKDTSIPGKKQQLMNRTFHGNMVNKREDERVNKFGETLQIQPKRDNDSLRRRGSASSSNRQKNSLDKTLAFNSSEKENDHSEHQHHLVSVQKPVNISNDHLNERESSHYLLREAQRYQKSSQHLKARELLEKALNLTPKSYDILYYLGISELKLSNMERAIECFMKCVNMAEKVKPNAYLILCITLKRLNKNLEAISILNRAFQSFPNLLEAYLLRAKLLLKEKKLVEAAEDFLQYSKAYPLKSGGFIGLGDTNKALGNLEEAVQNYTEALQKDDGQKQNSFLKRASCLIELKQFQKALEDLNEIISQDAHNSEAFYFKGLTYFKQKNVKQAILFFEQAVKWNSSKLAVTKSLLEISKMRIEQRDLYQANFILRRSDNLDVDKNVLKPYRSFTEGAVYLMKKKYEEGISQLTEAENNKENAEFLFPLIFAYRAYGYFCLNEHRKSLNDYVKLQRFGSLDKGNHYNKILCEGIVEIKKNNFVKGIQIFDSALKVFQDKSEPFFYKALSKILEINLNLDLTTIQRLKVLEESIQMMDHALDITPNNANLLFYSGFVRLSIGLIQDAMAFIEKAIEKSEDNIPKYFFYRGIANAALGNYPAAINDLSTAKRLDETYYKIYPYRGKCFLKLNKSKEAFLDFQKFQNYCPDDDSIHELAGDALFYSCSISEAIEAYSNSPHLASNPEILLNRAKCYVLLKELTFALQDLSQLTELYPNVSAHSFDRICLLSLKMASSKKNSEKSREDAIELCRSIERDQGGNIFKYYEMKFYLGAYLVYSNKYDEAIKEWAYSLELKENAPDDGYDMDALLNAAALDNEDQVHKFNSSVSTAEFYYNFAILYLLAGKKDKAIKNLNSLKELLSGKLKEKTKEIINLVKQENQVNRNEEEEVDLNLFSNEGRLCSIFPELVVKLGNNLTGKCSLSFCLPFINPPDLNIKIGLDLLKELEITCVENKPEAPWIKKRDKGIIFTECIHEKQEITVGDYKEYISLLDSKITLTDKMLGRMKKAFEEAKLDEVQEENNEQNNESENGHQNNMSETANIDKMKFDKEELKNQLKLDLNIENKLNKLIKKPQQPPANKEAQ